MGLLKPKAEKAVAQPVTREEFDALRAQTEAAQAVTALAVAAMTFAAKAAPGTPDANPRARLEKLAAAADLEPAERAALGAFLKRLDGLARAESRREFQESSARTAPRTFEDCRPRSWRG